MGNGLATIDVGELRRLYSGSGCAKAVLDHAAGRQKNSRKTDVDRLETVLRREGGKFSRRDIIGVLKKLEDLGCGRFMIGRRGQPSRFEWDVEMISLGRVAQGQQVDVVAIDAAHAEAEEMDDAEVEEPGIPAGTIRHTYMIRPDFAVVLDLPENLTTKEAIRLAEFVKTLPFDTAE